MVFWRGRRGIRGLAFCVVWVYLRVVVVLAVLCSLMSVSLMVSRAEMIGLASFIYIAC